MWLLCLKRIGLFRTLIAFYMVSLFAYKAASLAFWIRTQKCFKIVSVSFHWTFSTLVGTVHFQHVGETLNPSTPYRSGSTSHYCMLLRTISSLIKPQVYHLPLGFMPSYSIFTQVPFPLHFLSRTSLFKGFMNDSANKLDDGIIRDCSMAQTCSISGIDPLWYKTILW